MICSVVIPVHNHAALTQQCLNALLTYPARHIEQEIIVVNDASHDQTPQLLAGYGNRIRVLTHTTNVGFATACNTGAAQASGDFIVFLNNDTIPTVGWLDELVKYAQAHPQAAAIGSRLLFPNGTIQHAGVVIGQDRHPWHLYSGFPGDHPAVMKSRRFQIVTAACMLVRRAPFEAVGGFDTLYHNGYEDADLCLRLGQHGYEIHYCHKSVVYHLEGPTRGYSSLAVRHNDELFRQRWSHVQPDDIQYYLDDNLLRINYQYPYPVNLWIDPHLALVNKNERDRHIERLLDRRAGQIAELQREHSYLVVRTRPPTLTEPLFTPHSAAVVSQGNPLLVPGERHPVDIIVPIYNGLDYTQAAVDSIRNHTDLRFHTLMLIDDASPDSRIRDYLHALRQSSDENILILFNERNLGFPRTANRGMRVSQNDIILLNSDTIVTAGWVEKLQQAAHSSANVASVTPFSNNGNIFSAPRFNEDNPVPEGFTIDSFAALIERTSRRRYPEMPTAMGFCMYMRRDAIAQVGYFDEVLFGKGYGEENDWCMRAAKYGYKHVLDDSTYIYHIGHMSFTRDVHDEVVPEHIKILERLYPDYMTMIGRFCAQNPLRGLLNAIDLAMQAERVRQG